MIQINNYFFEPTDFNINFTTIGETKRTPFGGKIHSSYTNKYHTFKMKFTQLSPTQLSHFLYLYNLVFPPSGEPEDLTFIDDTNENYTTTIPIDGFDYNREKGSDETYSVDLTLEEVL